jgi:hypothetical protein
LLLLQYFALAKPPANAKLTAFRLVLFTLARAQLDASMDSVYGIFLLSVVSLENMNYTPVSPTG